MDEKKDRKGIIKLVCVLLSFSLWLYVSNVENPIRTITIRNIPIELENEDVLDESGLAISENQNMTIDLKIEGPANKVYSVSKNDFTLSIDLENYALKEGENTISIKVDSSPSDITIRNKDLLSIKLNIEEITNKEFTLENELVIAYQDGYSASSIDIDPAVVEVRGPKSLMKKVSKVALMGNISSISGDYSGKFDIYPLDEEGNRIDGLTLSKNKGTINISLNKSKEVDVKTSYIGNLTEGLKMKSETLSKNKIIIIGKSEVVDAIDEVYLESINLDEIKDSIKLTKSIVLPKGVKSDDNSISVELLIEKDKEEEKVQEEKTEVSKTLDVTVNYLDKNELFSYEMPSTVKITVKGTEEDVNNVTANDINVEASLQDIKEVGADKSVKWTATVLNDKKVTIENTTGVITVNVSELEKS